jgi:hypothetical protein
MKRELSSMNWAPLLGVLVQMAALGLCSWAMTSARNRGRELPGGKDPAPVVTGAPTEPA